MKSQRELKKRLKSIKNTAKITNTLEKVSLSKMKKFQDLAKSSMEYADEVIAIAVELLGYLRKLRETKQITDKEIIDYLTYTDDTSKPDALVVIAPTRGFTGSLMLNLLATLQKFSTDRKDSKIFGVGLQKKSAYLMSKFANIEIKSLFEKPIESTDFFEIEAEFTYLMSNYHDGAFNRLFILYAEYRGNMQYQTKIRQLLPLHEDDLKNMWVSLPTTNHKPYYLIEPSNFLLVKELIDRYLKTVFLFTVITSKASEHNARMFAMKNATDNALELREQLLLKYNKSRQESITGEILDIIGGNLQLI